MFLETHTQMETATWIQILDKVVIISHLAHTLEKGKNPAVIHTRYE